MGNDVNELLKIYDFKIGVGFFGSFLEIWYICMYVSSWKILKSNMGIRGKNSCLQLKELKEITYRENPRKRVHGSLSNGGNSIVFPFFDQLVEIQFIQLHFFGF